MKNATGKGYFKKYQRKLSSEKKRTSDERYSPERQDQLEETLSNVFFKLEPLIEEIEQILGQVEYVLDDYDPARERKRLGGRV